MKYNEPDNPSKKQSILMTLKVLIPKQHITVMSKTSQANRPTILLFGLVSFGNNGIHRIEPLAQSILHRIFLYLAGMNDMLSHHHILVLDFCI